MLLMSVDLVCGPILTLVLFSDTKQRAELVRDLGLVVFIQLCALAYGVYTMSIARPLFLVLEVDRFRAVSAADLQGPSATAELHALPLALMPGLFSSPKTVAIRSPKNEAERNSVLMESVIGGPDYSARPEFYIPYDATNALMSLKRAKPLLVFLHKQPNQQAAADKLALDKKLDLSKSMYLPVTGRQDWVAVLNAQGQIQGFLKGDGF